MYYRKRCKYRSSRPKRKAGIQPMCSDPISIKKRKHIGLCLKMKRKAASWICTLRKINDEIHRQKYPHFSVGTCHYCYSAAFKNCNSIKLLNCRSSAGGYHQRITV